MAGRKNTDWLAIRGEYLSDATLSYSELAKRHGLSKSAVQKKGTDEEWSKLRQNYADIAYENFQKKLLKTKEAAQDRHLQQFQNLQALINKSIQAIATQAQPDALELRRLSGALKDSVMGERVVLGLPTNVGSITDPEGNDAFKGFAEAFAAAEKVVNGDSSTTT